MIKHATVSAKYAMFTQEMPLVAIKKKHFLLKLHTHTHILIWTINHLILTKDAF